MCVLIMQPIVHRKQNKETGRADRLEQFSEAARMYAVLGYLITKTIFMQSFSI